MPPQPTVTQIRLNNITTCLTITASTLEILVGSLKSPFLVAVSNTTQSLLKNIEMVKQNKNECIQLMEQTYELLNAILMVHINSDTGAELPPSVLTHIGKFTETLHKSTHLLKLNRMVTMVNHIKDIAEMQEDAEKRHKEVLDMIEALSTLLVQMEHPLYGNSTPLKNQLISVIQISRLYSGSHNRAQDILWRNSEISDILHLFSQGTPKIAILGAGGMGKTSLARAVIHHTEITQRYNQHRFFVACDSAATQVELAALIGVHIGLKREGPHLLYNLETLWEPVQSRGKIEEFLSLLTDIADNTHDPKELDKVLSLTDNMPLAISLIAHLVDSEAAPMYYPTGSPRLNPHSKDLLSLLSMLPNGLSDVELVQSKLPLDNILGCKAALIRTALAYNDEHKRLKALVPIREYMQKIQPPGDHLIRPLRKHFQELLEFFMEYRGTQSSSNTVAEFSDIMGQGATSLIQQIQNVLPHPYDHHLEAYFIMECCNSWMYPISNAESDALEHFKEFDDPDLKCRFYNSLGMYYRATGDISSATKLCEAAISLALSTGNTKWHSQGLHNLACVEWNIGDYSAAQVHAKEAQRLALISSDLYREAEALRIEAICCYTLGNYRKAMSLCIRARDLLGLCGMSHGGLDHSIMNAQAEIHRLKSEYVEARCIHTSILEGTTIQDTYTYGLALLNVTEIDVLIGAPKNDVQMNCDRARKICPHERGKFIGSTDYF
ncbi:hypothetical protein B0H13DRAFT_1903700 [Mycena leptocephala]|nr:hypothetical protein B0H13DRAFT_1903700 [Mycena leptocephala]